MPGKLISTAPIEYAASIVSNSGVTAGPHKEAGGVLVSGYILCKSENLQEVEEWSKSCPILKYPESSVEIRPIVPFPVS